jgi:PleD family two-component response regulator
MYLSSVQSTPSRCSYVEAAELAGEGSILVIDDSITSRQQVSLILQKAGYRVLESRDGQDAIAQLYRHRRIELVICDGVQGVTASLKPLLRWNYSHSPIYEN